MKRYLAFYGANYYPSAAMGDFIGDFDTIEEALDAVRQRAVDECNRAGVEDPSDKDLDERVWTACWAAVYDTETREEVEYF